ncbi:MAG: cytochrome c biogenesis protein CcdA [Anaerolineae bacterium]|jgi:cytochrome c biogenesis protein CcdA
MKGTTVGRGRADARGKRRSSKAAAGWLSVALSFVIPAVLVVGLLVLLIRTRGGLEAGVASLTRLFPLGYAFAAGMVASVNPCGVLLLSSYAFYMLRTRGAEVSVLRQTLGSLLVAVVATGGFLLVFTIVGGVVTVGGRWLIAIFPYAGLVIGLAMVGLGGWLLVSRRALGLGMLTGSRAVLAQKGGLGNAFLFGVVYAAASVSCTLPVFLVVVGSALAGESALISLGQFVGYALGMGTIVAAVTVGAALFRRAMARWLRLLMPHVHPLNAMFLIGAGAYLIYYWVFQAGLT